MPAIKHNNYVVYHGNKATEKPMATDRSFKDEIIKVFSRTTRTEQERELLEELGTRQREADEMLRRHKFSCTTCNQAIAFFDTEGMSRQRRKIG